MWRAVRKSARSLYRAPSRQGCGEIRARRWQRTPALRHDAEMHDEDEPLQDWVRRREERRDASKGKRRAIPLAEGQLRGQHVQPHAPRVIQEWNGTEWEPVGLVRDLDAAKAVLYPPQPSERKPTEWDRLALGKGRGRHRRATPAEERER
ncbi:DUF6087 family protein [Streptomyces sp. NPDC002564]|uniref:DUF6087 family protein n=1 Tax=Streptomyces sp. NPDC002564 TaxID=3364649 RepID=UPI003697E476